MSREQIHELSIKNLTAKTSHNFRVQGSGIAPTLQWYGAFYAGDEYAVTVDGQPVALDQNGAHDPNSMVASMLNLT